MSDNQNNTQGNAAVVNESAAMVDAAPAAVQAADAIVAKIKEFGGDDDVASKIKELGVETLEDLVVLTESDLVGAGMKPVHARKLLNSLKKAPEAPATPAPAPTMAAEIMVNILPDVPSDESWLTSLKTGGVLKVDQSTVIAAIRAALAEKVGLYGIPKTLVAAMETFADENEEQVDPAFFTLRSQLTRRSYAEIFSAIDGLDGNYVTEPRKRQLFDRINSSLWTSISASFAQLNAWQQSWMTGAANPTAFMAVFAGGAMPPGMMSPPDTGALRDAGDDINNAINKVFSGTGVQIAAALAYEANEIRKTLENPRLPAMIGAANRDQMLKKLRVNVSSNYARLETNLVKYILSFINIDGISAGDEEIRYFSALWTLGNQIDWNQLGIKKPTAN